MVLVTTDVLKILSNEESLELFRIVALTKPDAAPADIIKSKTKTNLTRKQFYSRMSKLTKAGLIKRKKGKYTLTAFGKVVYDIVEIKIEYAVNNYWKLKSVDSLEMAHDLPTEERKKLIDNLIDNHEIKDILVSDTNKDDKSKLESDRPLPNMEQQHLEQKTNHEDKNSKM